MRQLRQLADKPGELYDNNKAAYGLLRYGVTVNVAKDTKDVTVGLIDWAGPEKNDSVIAEEVTLRGKHERRQDIVLYVNGIAIAVLELKNAQPTLARVSIKTCPTSSPSFTPIFSAPCNWFWPVTTPKALAVHCTNDPEWFALHVCAGQSNSQRF